METTYYTPKEVAERLKLRVHTIYDYIRKGRLPAVRFGNCCRIAASDLEAFLERQKDTVRSNSRRAEGDTAGTEALQGGEGVAADDLREQKQKYEAALRLLAEWMADESGYDERVWPIVEKLLLENPVSFGEPGHEALTPVHRRKEERPLLSKPASKHDNGDP